MNILITGANGQLGNEMRLLLAGSDHCVTYTDVVAPEGVETTILDITKLDAIRALCSEKDIQVIVNCAAYTNVDKAETDGELCELLNAKAPENLANVMKERDGLLVHVSTDYVFGGDPYNTPCREDQKGTPTGVYGLTKLHGEQNIQATGCKYIILRTAWLYSPFGKNFCKTMLNLTAIKPQLKVVFDQTGTPTYARDLAQGILKAVEAYSQTVFNGTAADKGSILGIYHFSNEGVCSWFDFTKMIQQIDNEMRAANGEAVTECEVLPCHSDEFPSPVKRPAYSVLDKTKFKETFGVKIPYWTDSLRDCIARIKKN